jgi:hypothetical protein
MGEQFYSRLNTVVSFTIAFLTLFSALLGWQMGNVANAAASAYDEAKRAELNRQRIVSTNKLKAFENQRAFLAYENFFEQYQLVSLQLAEVQGAETPDETLVQQLTSKQDEFQTLYQASLKLVNKKFIKRDGTYALTEELGQLIASDSRKMDIDPTPHKARAQELDAQVGQIQIALIILAVALFFFAITSSVESLKGLLRLAFTAIGYVAAVAGIVMGIMFWN